MLRADPGANSSCIISDDIMTVTVLLYLPVMVASSPIRINRNARDMDGPAPVAAVYIPHKVIIRIDRNFLELIPLPMMHRNLEIRA